MDRIVTGLGGRHGRSGTLRHLPSLVASLAPGALFGAGLVALRGQARFAWLSDIARWPWELWGIAIAGSLATAAGVLDWRYHRREGVVIGPNERRAELLALACGGLPLFVLMACASLAEDARPFLLPVFAVTVLTAVLIAYDEIKFHTRRCKTEETVLHRVLVFGHAAAFASWIHLCFVGDFLRGAGHV